jgi:hypothetical protein
MWPFQNADDAFCEAVQREFAPIAKDCGTTLQKVEPLIYGFRSQHAVLTIGAYPGHRRSVCVKLRSSGKEEAVCVKDGIDIGLANIELFITKELSGIYSERESWQAAPLRKEVADLARKVREVAMPFLTSPDADWDGVRDMIAARVSKMFDEKPWLKKYERALIGTD